MSDLTSPAQAAPQQGRRSTARDGLANRVEFFLTTHLGPVWRTVRAVPPLARQVNRLLINTAILKMPTRPNPFSTMAPYTSWPSLTDKTFSSRHLPAVPPGAAASPDTERVADLFVRAGETVLCPKSTVLFAYFAQWFTDGFLRSDRSEPRDPRKNTSNHDIDLSQLYGLKAAVTDQLRALSGGELKSQVVSGEEFPPYLCEDGVIKPEFAKLSVVGFEDLSVAARNNLFAMGGDRANSQIGYTALNVLFFREHNRVARLLAEEHLDWDDERLFHTARNILIVLNIKIVVEEYINHIAPYHFQFFLHPSVLRNAQWYRPNWVAIEFNLLYRWHSLVPSTLRVGGEDLPLYTTLFNNEILLKRGLGALFDDASRQPAGRIGLFNTDPVLRETEVQSILQARDVELASYNAYRACAKFPQVTAFDQISGDTLVQEGLRELYGDVDRIEFYVGLFAEDTRPNAVLPSLMGRMVGVDAFSQALTNPLLAPRVFNEQTFSPLGMRLINQTSSLGDIVRRNLPAGSADPVVRMTREDWRRTR